MTHDAQLAPRPAATNGWHLIPSARPADAERTVRELGERRVLAEVLARIPLGEVLLGPGDDAAVIATPDGRQVITTDTLIEGPDFRREWSHPIDLGRKAVASNLSDVAAMGARPTGLVIALAMPRETTLAWVCDFADGVRDGLERLAPGCGVIGGDLATSEAVTIAVTAFGSLDGRAPVTRAGARPGDAVAVAGTLGRAAAGLTLLFDGADADADAECAPATTEVSGGPSAAAAPTSFPELDATPRTTELAQLRQRLIDVQRAPTPPVEAGVAAARAGATAMMDCSDGLLLDLDRLAQRSGVVIDIDTRLLGDDVAALAPVLGDRALTHVLGGGEDHSLLATFPADVAPPHPFRRIGTVVDGTPGVRVDGADADPAGWDPYR